MIIQSWPICCTLLRDVYLIVNNTMNNMMNNWTLTKLYINPVYINERNFDKVLNHNEDSSNERSLPRPTDERFWV